MKTINTNQLQPNTYFTSPVYLDSSYIILSQELPVTQELIKRLNDWKYNSIFTDSEQIISSAAILTNSEEPEKGVLDKNIAEKNREKEVKAFYVGWIAYAEDMFKQLMDASTIDMTVLTSKIKSTVELLKENKDQLIILCTIDPGHDNFLIPHTVYTTILSLIIGDYLRLPPHRVIELGISAVLHEIGMLRIPPALFSHNRLLTPDERKTLTAHTALGYRILKNLSVHENIAACALEHHERIDGSGYPRGMRADMISQYAKIVGTACAFSAMVAKRNFKSQMNGHKAMIELLVNKKTQFDDTILKAMVHSISFFPPGTFIQLSNNSIGMVCKTDPANPKTPFIKIFIDDKGSRIAHYLVIQPSAEKGIAIKRVLEPVEAHKLKLLEDQ